MQQRELSTKERIIAAVSNIIYSLRYVFVGFLLALLLFVIVYLIVGEIRSSRIEKSTIIVERIESDYELWSATEDEAERETLGSDLLFRLDEVISAYPRLYAAQRGLFIQAQIFYATGVWESSKASFIELADRFPDSYVAPVALINAATAMEADENIAEAVSLLERVVAEFDTPALPSVLFTLGRLSEQSESIETAIQYYERLLDEYPSSGWTSIAQSRIIVLKIDRS